MRHESILFSLVTDTPPIPLETGIKTENKYPRMWFAVAIT